MREEKKKECLRKCGTLLAQRDYTCARLREKLLRGGYEEEIADEVIGSLREARYLDDARYARSFIEAHRGDRSRLRIRKESSIPKTRIGMKSGKCRRICSGKDMRLQLYGQPWMRDRMICERIGERRFA